MILFILDRKNFSVIHFTGYLKSWAPERMGLDDDNECETDSCNLSCLVAVGQLQPPFKAPYVPANPNITVEPVEFLTRTSVDAKFLFVDQK